MASQIASFHKKISSEHPMLEKRSPVDLDTRHHCKVI